ncbi:hypothetical protein HK101_007234 [Irineochytrium annulatum]|nr:hypothetical protein HK101_007234 [Irineochytrium annulatum]
MALDHSLRTGDAVPTSAKAVGSSGHGLRPAADTVRDKEKLRAELEATPKQQRLERVMKGVRRRNARLQRAFVRMVRGLQRHDHPWVAHATVVAECLQMWSFAFWGVGWGVFNPFAKAVLALQVSTLTAERQPDLAPVALYTAAMAILWGATALTAWNFAACYRMAAPLALELRRAQRFSLVAVSGLLLIPLAVPLFWSFTTNSVALQFFAALSAPWLLVFSAAARVSLADLDPKSKNLLARSTTRPELIEITVKIGLAAIFVLVRRIAVLRFTFLLFVMLALLLVYYVALPFYNRRVLAIKFISYSVMIVWSAAALVLACFRFKGSGNMSTITLYTFICAAVLTPAVSVGAYYLINWRVDSATSYAVSLSIFKKNEEAKKIDADHRVDSRFWHSSQVEIATRFLSSYTMPIKLADSIFMDGLDRYHNPQIYSALNIMNAVYKDDQATAKLYLKRALDCHPFFDLLVIIWKITDDIANGIGRRTAANGQTILGGANSAEFKHLIARATLAHKEAKLCVANFWQCILYTNEDSAEDDTISTLVGLVYYMETSDTIATQSYEELLEKFPQSRRALANYAQFLEEIHQDDTEALNIRKRLRKIPRADDEVNVIRKDSATSDKTSDVDTTKNPSPSALWSMSRKERAAHRLYKKQVQSHSHRSGERLVWTVRSAQAAFALLAVAQVLVSVYGQRFIQFEIDLLGVASACRQAFVDLHGALRSLQALAMTGAGESMTAAGSQVLEAVKALADNSTQLFESAGSHVRLYALWGTPSVTLDVYLGGGGEAGGAIDPMRVNWTQTLRDATMTYTRRAVLAVKHLVSHTAGWNITTLDGDPDARFVLDNGLITLADSYGKMTSTYADVIRRDVDLLGILQLVIIPATLIILLITAYVVFVPIRSAKINREATLRAFLEVPKPAALNIYRLYYDPSSAVSKDNLDVNAKDSSSEDPEEELEPASGPADPLLSKAFTMYARLMRDCIAALIFILIASSAGSVTNFVTARTTRSFPALLALGYDARAAAGRAPAVVMEAALGNDSALDVRGLDFTRPWASAAGVLRRDAGALVADQAGILYGNVEMGIPRDFAKYKFFDVGHDAALGSYSTYGVTSLFVERVGAVAQGIPEADSSAETADLKELSRLIMAGYDGFVDEVEDVADASLSIVTTTASVMFCFFVAVIVLTYTILWRRVLKYLLRTEIERTMKLLLMIPADVASDMPVLRQMLRLRQSGVHVKVQAQTRSGSYGHSENGLNHQISIKTS